MTSKMEIGRGYRIQAMWMLTRLGYATTRQIAMGLFGGCTATERQQASRTIRWLLAQGYVVEKRSNGSASGERQIALARAGVAALGAEMALVGNKQHARDWLRHAHAHRTACNSVWAARYRGLTNPGFTELEIRAGAAPERLSLFAYQSVDFGVQRKIPDLLLTPSGGDEYVWVEVENAWRGPKDLRKLVSFLRAMFHASQPEVHQVWLVVTAAGARSIGKRLRAAMTHDLTSGYSAVVKALDARILAEHIKVYELDSDLLDLVPILF